MSRLLFNFFDTKTGSIGVSQNKSTVLLSGSEAYPSTSAVSQKKAFLTLTATTFSGTAGSITVSQNKSTIALIGGVAPTGAIAIFQNKSTISITDIEDFIGQASISQKKSIIAITGVTPNNFGPISVFEKKASIAGLASPSYSGTLAIFQKKASPLINLNELFSGTVAVSEKKDSLNLHAVSGVISHFVNISSTASYTQTYTRYQQFHRGIVDTEGTTDQSKRGSLSKTVSLPVAAKPNGSITTTESYTDTLTPLVTVVYPHTISVTIIDNAGYKDT